MTDDTYDHALHVWGDSVDRALRFTEAGSFTILACMFLMRPGFDDADDSLAYMIANAPRKIGAP